MALAKGTVQLGVGVDKELADTFRTFCERRGETFRHHLELAMRRHLDNPPPLPSLPPLPPVTAAAPAKRKGKK